MLTSITQYSWSLWNRVERHLTHEIHSQHWDTVHWFIRSIICSFIQKFVKCQGGEGNGTPLQYSCLENPMDRGAWWAAVHGAAKSRTRLNDFTFTFHFHALEKEMATHSSLLAWRIPGMGEPRGLPSMGLHRAGHDLAAAAVAGLSSVLFYALGMVRGEEYKEKNYDQISFVM